MRIPPLGVALVAVTLAVPPNASGQTGSPATAHLAALVAQYDSAWNRRDTDRVSRLLAPGYQYFTSRGGVSSRAETITFLTAPEYVLDHARRSEVVIKLSGPIAVVSSRWQGRGAYRGERFVDDQRCGQVWQQSADAWKLLSEHCVQIAPAVPPPASN